MLNAVLAVLIGIAWVPLTMGLIRFVWFLFDAVNESFVGFGQRHDKNHHQ